MAGAESETNVGSRFSHGTNGFRRLNVEKQVPMACGPEKTGQAGQRGQGSQQVAGEGLGTWL